MVENHGKNDGNIGKHRETWWKTMEKNDGHIGKDRETWWKTMEKVMDI
jgi:hypothetical protein